MEERMGGIRISQSQMQNQNGSNPGADRKGCGQLEVRDRGVSAGTHLYSCVNLKLKSTRMSPSNIIVGTSSNFTINFAA